MNAITFHSSYEKLDEILHTRVGLHHFSKLYPEEVKWYLQNIRFGIDNVFVRAALKAIYQQEMERDADGFMSFLENIPLN